MSKKQAPEKVNSLRRSRGKRCRRWCSLQSSTWRETEPRRNIKTTGPGHFKSLFNIPKHSPPALKQQPPPTKTLCSLTSIMLNGDFTQQVIGAMGPKTSPKMRRILGSLIRHIHEFTNENQITVEEWMAGVEFINRIGQISDARRNEGILVSDVFGLETLVDSITYSLEDSDHTSTAIIGPFYRENSPKYPNGHTILQMDVGGQQTYVHGKVTDTNGNPLAGAQVEVWQCAPNGLYEQQDDNQPDYNLRGTFTTDEHGNYAFIGIKPTSYPIPYDGPAGDLLQMMDRHPFRPSHIHWRVSHDGFRPLITQIYDRSCEYVQNDSVFAVKEELIVDFVEPSPELKAAGNKFELTYNIALPSEEKVKSETAKRLHALQAREAELTNHL